MIDKTKVYYVAGMMRPLPDFNFPLFERVSKMLRLDGYKIISPHEMGSPEMTRGALMTEDLLAILHGADGVICLPGWQNSSGASCEVAVAFATEKPVYEFIERDLLDFRTLEKHPGSEYVLVPSPVVSVMVPREQQYALQIPLIGVCGYAQVGKDTLAAHLVGEYGWTRVAFADALREVLYALDPYILDAGGRQDANWARLHAVVDSNGWDLAKTRFTEIRTLLQRLGTEAGRQIIDENLWVRMGEEKIESAGTPVVVTDCRFQNEVALIKRRKGVLIWVDRPGVGPANAHASEHSVTQADCDYVLYNDGTIEDFHKKVGHLVSVVLKYKTLEAA